MAMYFTIPNWSRIQPFPIVFFWSSEEEQKGEAKGSLSLNDIIKS